MLLMAEQKDRKKFPAEALGPPQQPRTSSSGRVLTEKYLKSLLFPISLTLKL